jgi:hypothetical protein
MAEGMTEGEKWHFDLHGWVSTASAQPAPSRASALG